MLSIVSYNLNGIRSAIDKGLVDWLAAHNFDIVCFQETKAQPEQVDLAAIEALGYHAYWHSAEKKGYSGVMTLSRRPADTAVVGCGIADYDCEGRILRTDFGDWTLLNCYFPSGTTGEERQGVKMRFLEDFFHYVQELRQTRPRLIVLGDYNIAHNEIDIHDPVRNKTSTGFLPEERAWMSKWFESGFVDGFRALNPDLVQYSWWSFRAGARKNNKGWRIDYQSVTENLRDRLHRSAQLTDVVHSDHCPVWLEINL